MNWISVKDKMPHVGQDVLVYSPNAYGSCMSVERVYNAGAWKPMFNKGWNEGESEFAVTHWMPLPEPPKP